MPEVLCVADNAGYPIALRRLDGGKVTSVQIAMNKAFTAAGHRKRTDNYKNSLPGEEAFGIWTQHGGRFTVFVGGFPIMVDGQCVGGIGASGGNGEQDKFEIHAVPRSSRASRGRKLRPVARSEHAQIFATLTLMRSRRRACGRHPAGAGLGGPWRQWHGDLLTGGRGEILHPVGGEDSGGDDGRGD